MPWLELCLQAGRMPALSLSAVAVLVSGCGSGVPSGSTQTGLTLDCLVFQDPTTGINRIFDLDLGGRTCSAGGCHSVNGGSGGAFKIYPNATPGTLQMEANFLAAKGFANLTSPSDSKLLLEPLAGAQSIVGSHTGGDIFPDSSDPNYMTIYTWIVTQVQGPSTCLP